MTRRSEVRARRAHKRAVRRLWTRLTPRFRWTIRWQLKTRRVPRPDLDGGSTVVMGGEQ